MDEMTWLKFLRNTSVVCNGIGLVIALAFLVGPKALAAISKVLDAYHPSISLEKVMEGKARLILGLTLLVITILMLALVINIRLS